MKPLQLYVKRKSGCISYVEDPYGLRSTFFQSVAKHRANVFDLLNFTAEAKNLQLYAKYLCTEKEDQYFSLSKSRGNSLGKHCNEILIESLLDAKTDSIELQLALYDAITSIEKKTFLTKTVWDLRLLRTFFEARGKLKSKGSFQILSDQVMATLCQRLDMALACSTTHEEKTQQMMSDSFGPGLVWFNE